MAPEQYRGAPPDPRTDQFAFCVTAWQALTGERPFKGTTLDELRKCGRAAASRTSRRSCRARVRAVLARGLDPDRAKRWASLEDLLDALERAAAAAGSPSARSRSRCSGSSMAALIVVRQRATPGTEHDRGADGCEPPERVFAEAWSPAVRTELAKLPGVRADAFERVAAASSTSSATGGSRAISRRAVRRRGKLREHATRLLRQRARRGQCAEPLARARRRRRSLRAVRRARHACQISRLRRQHRRSHRRRSPTDQPRRGKSLAVLARAIELRGVPSEQLRRCDRSARAAKRRRSAGQPLAASISVDRPATAAAAVTSWLRARTLFDRAPAEVRRRLRDARLEAIARIGLLEASIAELEKPGAPVPPDLADPRTKRDPAPRADAAFTAARGASGSDDMLARQRRAARRSTCAATSGS